MKFLIGVCGIGKGHCIREYEICKELIKRGHEVRILTYNEGVDFFSNINIKSYEVYVPFIVFKGEHVKWLDCIKRNFFKFIPGTLRNIKVYRKIIKDDFIPDFCISDYEPVVARISYKIKKPLINIDQQSKFMYMKENSINGYYCIEEKKRLGLFFPNFNKKYIVSFYELPKEILPSNVEIVYPIIRDDLKRIKVKNGDTNNVLIYFSKYIDMPIKQKVEDIIEILNKFPNYKFTIFSTEYFEKEIHKGNNVIIKRNDRKDFIETLRQSIAIISTAGHTLISEALYCNIPAFVIPLSTYDQNYCAKFIKENNIGYSSDKISYENLNKFLSNIDSYKENIKRCENLQKPMNTLNYIISQLEKM